MPEGSRGKAFSPSRTFRSGVLKALDMSENRGSNCQEQQESYVERPADPKVGATGQRLHRRGRRADCYHEAQEESGERQVRSCDQQALPRGGSRDQVEALDNYVGLLRYRLRRNHLTDLSIVLFSCC